jgi:TolB-like protein/Tfp pilus assembly protein PilF
MVLGTAAYMSPEQVRGEPADARSDIFSFGAVLYEMLSGERAFRGPTAVESMNAILNEDPAAVSSLKPGLPPALVQIVTRCLEKQPDERFHSAHDLGIALETVSGAPGEGRGVPTPPPRALLPRRRGWIALAAVIALFLLALPLGFNLGDLRDRSPGDTPAGSIESIAVLPLENLSGDPVQEYFSDGMTDVLISELGKVQALRVISRQSVMQFKGSERPVPEIARVLGVDAVVEGSVQRSGDRARTTIRLLRSDPEQLLWSESYDRDLGDILVLQGDLAREIATAVQVTVTPEERARLTARRPANPEAHDAYFKGLYFLGRDLTVDRAVRYFEQALQADPEYAPAYARLASCYTHLANLGSRDPEPAFARAEAAALRALQLDESLPEPHIILASIRFNRDWDWAEAEREVNRALRLNSSDASAHFRMGEHLVVMGQFEEGIAALRRAQALAPLKPATHTRVAMLLHFARRYDESIRESQRALELDPDYYWANAVLGVTYGQIGRHEEAIAYLRKACAVTADDRVKVSLKAALGRAYALSGHRGQAEEILREVRDKAEYAWSIDLAGLLAAVGKTDEALDVLEDAFERRVGTITWINVEPKVDPLRDEPRFQALVRRLDFPEV